MAVTIFLWETICWKYWTPLLPVYGVLSPNKRDTKRFMNKLNKKVDVLTESVMCIGFSENNFDSSKDFYKFLV